ncbi:triple tyrosine motif-containing protein [Urechidicola vernalis]|uniref:Triple tyrosine motif-containing protein n=1 Tax=Urechidicola vernalis TaxID=3075600 RepID=A0ABU2Y5F4_9FLAO|nr:triple tyrosine motif-containing protein [Urechidicola sp. P050]MDT0553429.1 triple tyrosine motif-containing protein [Urechidicola sp. P050]
MIQLKEVRFIFSILCVLASHILIAQELPPIKNFSPADYNSENQNWSISQSANGYMYVANNSGLLEFNGANWKLYGSPNGTIIRSVNVIKDLIFTGCYMEFGYWKRDQFGNLNYYSLIDKIGVPLIKDEQFWSILEFDGWILFQSLDRIYLYNLEEESFNVISAKSSRAGIFKVANKIYFQKINEGLYKIENGKALLVSDNEVIKKDVLIGAFINQNKTLLLTENGMFYHLIGDKIERWQFPAEDELVSKNVYCSIKLQDESLLLGTTSNGIIHLESDGSLIRKINKEQGLYNNTILSVFEDGEKNIWLGLDNGISVLNLYSPFTVYNDLKGLIGDVYATKIYAGYFYIGTNQGLFYKKLGSRDEFNLIDNTKGQVWCLKELKNTLFCGHNKGTFAVEKDKVTQVSEFAGTWEIKEIGVNDSLLIQGNYNGLSILERKNDKWAFRNKIEGFDISSRFFEFIKEDEIIVNHENNGTFILGLDKELQNIEIRKNEEAYGFGSSLMRYNDEIIYSTNGNKNIYSYDPSLEKFVWNELLTTIFYNEGNSAIGTLISDPISKNIWGFSDRNIICLLRGKFNEEPREIDIPVSNLFRKNLGVVGFENLTYLKEDVFLIGGSNGYVKLDLNKFETQKKKVSINSISKEFRNLPIENVSLNEVPEFKANENNLRFAFNVPEYNKYSNVEYQYQLIGIYDDWSSWFEEPNVSFENLPYGDYVFNVKARIGNVETENIESFSFNIEKPWYFSISMLFVYVLTFSFLLVFIHKNYKKHYTIKHHREIKERERKLKIENLNSEKELMRVRNENLRHDIDNRNRELGASTMSLIKKNEFLNAIKKELSNVRTISSIGKVISLIDDDLNSSDDWKLFEKSFTNVEKDFFRNLKEIHPTLSPNDLKLCAYLKLNLSSKEIAPLLNISVKSVEVKRYRLRKKLDLSQKSSLTNYLFEI